MRVESYKCDVCGREKQAVNHWWLMLLGASKKWFSIQEWDDNEADKATFHLCGAECVQKKVNEFLSK